MASADSLKVGDHVAYTDEDGRHEGVISRRVKDDDGDFYVLTLIDGGSMRLEIASLVLEQPTIH